MLWFTLSELDTLDIVIFAVALVVAIYFLYVKFIKSDGEKPYSPTIVAAQPRIDRQTSANDSSFVNRMKNGGRTVAVFYGSQTGTAEELAGRLAKDAKKYGMKALALDPEECEMEELPQLREIENSLAIFCISTYGEGDPTDNAQLFHEMVQSDELELSGLRYTVFGLGNKTYEHYNAIGEFFDKRLEELGAERIYELGLGDDDGNLEEDFMRWREGFWPRVCETFDLEVNLEDQSSRQYRLEVVNEPNSVGVFKGELGRLGSFERQRPPFDTKNPFLAPVVVNEELHKGGDRSCRHIELLIENSKLRYEAGDHVAVFPTNDPMLVNRFAELLDADLDAVFKLINTDEESSKKYPFPCPCSYRTALLHYVDITSPLKTHVLKEMSFYCADEADKTRLQLLSSSSDEGLAAYHTYIQQARRSILDVLVEFPSCRPTLDHILELMPRLQARYYSISSSPKADTNRISVTAVVLNYELEGRKINGVATNYLKLRQPAGEETPKVPIFVRKSTLRLPHRPTTPVIMIGPGCGFAPFRGFLQDRCHTREQGKEIGEMILFFGCRSRAEDFIYEQELTEYVNNKTLTELHVAFSREQAQKVYVQHKLWDQRQSIWKLVSEKGAHIYICGDARHMARDVQETFRRIFGEVGGVSEEAATQMIKDMERQRRYQADVWS